MGDRANIRISDIYGEAVWLYTHWCGTELPFVLKDALSIRERWMDASGLAGIVFWEMTRYSKDVTTGYGISAVCLDGDDRILSVSVPAQIVKAGYLKVATPRRFRSCRRWTFEEFSQLAYEELETIWDTVKKACDAQ